eukprot:27407-Pelagococcus_subviridis.AAC.2
MAARRRARERDATRGGGVSEDGSETSDPFAFIVSSLRPMTSRHSDQRTAASRRAASRWRLPPMAAAATAARSRRSAWTSTASCTTTASP